MYQPDFFDDYKSYKNRSTLLTRVERLKSRRDLKSRRSIEAELIKQGYSFPGHPRYNGNIKYRTLDCDGCPYLSIILENELCLVGRSWKRISPRENPRKCEYRENPSNKIPNHL